MWRRFPRNFFYLRLVNYGRDGYVNVEVIGGTEEEKENPLRERDNAPPVFSSASVTKTLTTRSNPVSRA